jgi:hypothetical protein
MQLFPANTRWACISALETGYQGCKHIVFDEQGSGCTMVDDEVVNQEQQCLKQALFPEGHVQDMCRES